MRGRERVERRKGFSELAAYPSPFLLELRRNPIEDAEVTSCEQAEEALRAGGFLDVESLFVPAQLQLDRSGVEVDPAPERAEIRLHILRAAKPPNLSLEGLDRLVEATGGLLQVACAPSDAAQAGQSAGFAIGPGAHTPIDRESFLMVDDRTLPVPPPGFHLSQAIPALGSPWTIRSDVGEQDERTSIGELGATEIARSKS